MANEVNETKGLHLLKNFFLVEGVLLFIIGILAIALPGIFTLGTELFVGILLLVGGIVQLIRTFQSQGSTGFVSSLLSSLIYIVVGGLLLVFPVQGVVTLTLLLLVYFIIDGLSKLYFGFEVRSLGSWGWFVLSGVISLILAYIIWAGLPGTAIWVIGLLVGINMLFSGAALIALGWSLPKEQS
jgi:uncharacterized membrane protein HdeD (DUF308 family)